MCIQLTEGKLYYDVKYYTIYVLVQYSMYFYITVPESGKNSLSCDSISNNRYNFFVQGKNSYLRLLH